jgi:transposase-like protein
MKCPSCNKGEMKKIKGIIEEDGIEYKGFRCNKCNEEIMNMSQLKNLAAKYTKT